MGMAEVYTLSSSSKRTLPGFNRLSGSRARLTVRIRAKVPSPSSARRYLRLVKLRAMCQRGTVEEGPAKKAAPDAVFARTSPFQFLRELDQLLRELLDRSRRLRLPRRALPQDRAVDVAVSDVGHNWRHQPGLLDEDVGPRDKLGEARDWNADVGDL